MHIAIRRDICSIMLVVAYDENFQTGSGPMKYCTRLQCCQGEQGEFGRMPDHIVDKFERISLGNKLE